MKTESTRVRLFEFFWLFQLCILSAAGSPPGIALAATREQAGAAAPQTNTGLLSVDVVVLDAGGQPMAGIKKKDFRVFLDGEEQKITRFEEVSESAATPSDQTGIEEGTRRGKVVLLLFDQNTIRSGDTKLVLDAAENYVRRHMQPYDLMGVALHVQSLKIASPLTHDSGKVIEAIRHANAAGMGAPAVEEPTGAKELRSQGIDVFRSLKGLCTELGPIRGRKTILMFTGDMSVPIDILSEFNSLVTEARKSDVSFFTLDARGRSGSGTTSASLPDPISAPRPSRSTEVNLAQFQNQTTATIFRSLAEQTGGYPIYNTDNLDEALDRLEPELGNFYLLGFESALVRSDGKPHKIEVKLDLKEAKLKYRDSYMNPHPTDPLAGSKIEKSLQSALSSASPATAVPISFCPVYFYESPLIAQVPVFVKIGRGSIVLRKKADQWVGSASIMGVALSEDGAPASRFSGEINIAIDKTQAEAFRRQDLIYRNYLRLRPGKYRLKLAVMDEKGKVGRSEEELSIPVFDGKGLAASSLIVSQEMVPLPGLIRDLGPEMMSQADPMQFQGFQIYAPVGTEIDRRRPMAIFYRIYGSPGGKARSFKVKVQATDEQGEVHSFPPVNPASSTLTVSQTGSAIGFVLPCGDLKPGRYHLTVETAEAGSGQSVICGADFQLR